MGGCAYRRMGSCWRSLRTWLAAIAVKALPIATVRMATINPLPSRIFTSWITAMQRLEPFAGGGSTRTDCHTADIGYGNRLWHEWRLNEVVRS